MSIKVNYIRDGGVRVPDAGNCLPLVVSRGGGVELFAYLFKPLLVAFWIFAGECVPDTDTRPKVGWAHCGGTPHAQRVPTGPQHSCVLQPLLDHGDIGRSGPGPPLEGVTGHQKR